MVRTGVSERTGRGGRNEDAKKNLPDTVVLGAVGYMLDTDTKAKEGSLNLTSLFKKRGRRRKKRADVEAFSDEDDYVAPSCMINTSAEGSRKSKRITMRLESVETAIKESSCSPQHHDKENLNTANTSQQQQQPGAADQPGTSGGEAAETRDNEGSARERKLEQIRDICAEKLPAAVAAAPTSAPAAASASAASPHKFLEPGSSSEDEQAAAAARRDNRYNTVL